MNYEEEKLIDSEIKTKEFLEIISQILDGIRYLESKSIFLKNLKLKKIFTKINYIFYLRLDDIFCDSNNDVVLMIKEFTYIKNSKRSPKIETPSKFSKNYSEKSNLKISNNVLVNLSKIVNEILEEKEKIFPNLKAEIFKNFNNEDFTYEINFLKEKIFIG